MSEENIDYKALFEQVQRENEAIKLGMLKARYTARVAFSEHLETIRDFVQRNYLVLVFATILLSTLCSGIYTVWRNRGEK